MTDLASPTLHPSARQANKAVYNAESLNLWLAFWCDLVGALLVLVVSAFSVAQKGEHGT